MQHRVHTDSLTPELKRELWDEIVQDFESSGETMRQYSDARGLKMTHLNYYVYASRKKQTPAFVPIHLPEPIKQQELRVECGRVSLSIPTLLEPSLLKMILSTVASVC